MFHKETNIFLYYNTDVFTVHCIPMCFLEPKNKKKEACVTVGIDIIIQPHVGSVPTNYIPDPKQAARVVTDLKMEINADGVGSCQLREYLLFDSVIAARYHLMCSGWVDHMSHFLMSKIKLSLTNEDQFIEFLKANFEVDAHTARLYRLDENKKRINDKERHNNMRSKGSTREQLH